MFSYSLPTRDEISQYLRKKSVAFGQFAYNKESKQFFGRTPLSWGKICLFYLVFYAAIGGFFAIHLILFTCHLPEPDPGISPRNFAKYAYPNFPNSQIHLLAIPRSINYNGQTASMPSDDAEKYRSLLASATEVGVDPVCINSTTNYGYSNQHPCVLLHVSRVFSWTPELISPLYASGSYLNIVCSSTQLDALNISMQVTPLGGIPLNGPTGRRFPFSNQEDYSTPVMSVVFNLTNLVLSAAGSTRLGITCSLNASSVPYPIPLPPTFKDWYEVPKPTMITLDLHA